MKTDQAALTLFFTGGVSLKTWDEVGNLEREAVLYRKLVESLIRIDFVTYGAGRDSTFSDRLHPIGVLPTTWHQNKLVTTGRLLLRHSRSLRRSDIFKTNQIRGAEIPLLLKKLWGKKVIVRCGYLLSQFTRNRYGDGRETEKAFKLERKAFLEADAGIVTSDWQKEYVVNEHGANPEKITVIPNYVVTDVFRPQPEFPLRYDMAFIGRGGEQKNLPALLEALHLLEKQGRRRVSLVMAGNCCTDSAVREGASRMGLNITFAGNVPNFELPTLLNQARVFILPSLYEGHPKVLLEAMSCGRPCIGTDVTGIHTDIRHLETGYLCSTDHHSLARAIDEVLGSRSLQVELGQNARQYILDRYSLDEVVRMELDVIRSVTELNR